MLRRRHLEEIGGIAGVSITEDAETALELHARGYNSVYISEPMVAGLQPETFAGFIGQRTRWAQGMLQILLLKNPLLKRGLSLPQRICYLSSSVFWLFPLARTIFLFMPLTYLFFGMKIYNASFEEFCAYALAHLACSMMLTNHLFGKVRWPFISELYEMTQALFVLPALLSVFVRPRAPTFKVTAKAETLQTQLPLAPRDAGGGDLRAAAARRRGRGLALRQLPARARQPDDRRRLEPAQRGVHGRRARRGLRAPAAARGAARAAGAAAPRC